MSYAGSSPMTLRQLNARVRQALDSALPDCYWVTAELSEVRLSSRGHCFLHLVEKDARSSASVAEAKAVVWANVYPLLKLGFEQETGQPFAAGIKVMLQVEVTFHEVYGYSLTVTDIDASYTLGDMARRRREILQQLEAEGVLDLNRSLDLPRPLRRIAVVSSATAAGYGDFCNQLDSNAAGYGFVYRLFPATMQGERTAPSIVAALEQILEQLERWDAVVIIRGGGAVSDLSGYEDYELANNVAQFPLPVIVGIGHDRDKTVLDFVAHTSLKTPTAVAAFLIEQMDAEAALVAELEARLHAGVQQILNQERRRQEALRDFFRHHSQTFRHQAEARLQYLGQMLRTTARQALRVQQLRLQLCEEKIQLNDPQRILSRGFSITLHNGRALRSAADVRPGDRLVTRLAEGEVVSEVK